MFKILATAATLSLAALSANAATIVVNGGFETGPAGTGQNGNTFASMPGAFGSDSWDIYSSFPGWTLSDGELEIQTRNTIPLDPFEGDYYAELDGNRNNAITQSVNLTVGRYTLSFAYSPRVNEAGQPINTNSINYSLGNLASGLVTGPSMTYPLGEWTVVTNNFTVTTAGSYLLTFDAAGNPESLGGFIDGIKIAAVPVPAGGLLLIGAIGGLAALRRRKA